MIKTTHLLVATLLWFGYVESAQTLTYNKVSGSGTLTTTYTVNKTPDSYDITVASKDQMTEIKSEIPYQLLSFAYKSKKNTDFYTFTLNGSTLIADGQIKGQKLRETYKVDKTLWIQEFDFGLLPLLTSTKKSLNFEILHPKTFKLHKMVAKKQGTSSITVGDKTYMAQQVDVTLQGFKSMFWKAQIWYDITTHDLLMYKANEGPHTPTTTISLASKTEDLTSE